MNEQIFKNIIDKMTNNNLNMESLIITCDGNEYKHLFVAENPKNIRSLSKTITALALGVAIEKGYFKNGIEENIMNYFNDIKIVCKNNIKYLDQLKIKHLITLSTGYEEQILTEKHIATLDEKEDLCKFALNYPMHHNPGDYFFYSNAPIYLLSIIIEKETGKKLSSFVVEEILQKLQIKNYNWLESKQNHTMGCTGLELTPSDLHKIGVMMMNNGMYNNEQIIPDSWLKEMTTLKIETPNKYNEEKALPKYGYGYNLWICKNGIYYHDGSDGQYLITIPNKKMVITITAKEQNMNLITECIRELCND
jgi:Beta-lactamase class C and other penicillin binding proteins